MSSVWTLSVPVWLADAIDCESDPCHLMWLGRNYRHLFKTIYGARCLNGYPISSLEREQFDFCIEKVKFSQSIRFNVSFAKILHC